MILSRIGWPQPGFFESTTTTPLAVMKTDVLPPPPFVSDVQAAMKAGKSVDDVAGGWKIPAKYAGYAPITTPGDKVRVKNNVALAYKELGSKGTK